MNRAPSLHPLLDGTPGPETRKGRCLHLLAERANLIVALIDLLKAREPLLREPERYADGLLREHHRRDDALSAIEEGQHQKAADLLRSYGKPAVVPEAKP